MMVIKGVGQISVTVHDLDRAIQFYRDILGLKCIWQANGMAFFMCGDVRLLLSVPEAPEFDYPSSVIYYAVDDIEKAYREMLSRGVEFRGAPREIGRLDDRVVYMAFFSDSEGNTVAIQSEVMNP